MASVSSPSIRRKPAADSSGPSSLREWRKYSMAKRSVVFSVATQKASPRHARLREKARASLSRSASRAGLVPANPERRQLVGKGRPVVLRLAFGGAEEVNRLGRRTAHKAEDIRIAQQREAVGGQGLQVVAQHEDATGECRDRVHQTCL